MLIKHLSTIAFQHNRAKIWRLCRLEMTQEIRDVLANSAKVVYSRRRRQVSLTQESQSRALRSTNEPFTRCLEPAREAFTEVLKTFSFILTKDSQKICLARQASCMEDVQSAVADAKSRYDTGRQKNSVSI